MAGRRTKPLKGHKLTSNGQASTELSLPLPGHAGAGGQSLARPVRSCATSMVGT